MPASAAGSASISKPTGFEIKSAQLPLVALLLKSENWDTVCAELQQQYGQGSESADFFDNDPLVIDFSHLPADAAVQDMVPLLRVLRSCNLIPVAVRGARPEWTAAALAVGLVEAPPEVVRVKQAEAPIPVTVQEVVREVQTGRGAAWSSTSRCALASTCTPRVATWLCWPWSTRVPKSWPMATSMCTPHCAAKPLQAPAAMSKHASSRRHWRLNWCPSDRKRGV